MKAKLSIRRKLYQFGTFLLTVVGTQYAHGTASCLPKQPLKIAFSGNGTYIYNVCTETGANPNCSNARTANPPQDFKNSVPTNNKLFTGYEANAQRLFGYRQAAAAALEIGQYFDKNNDGFLDEADCPPFRVAMVGYSNGGWAAAEVAALMKQKARTGPLNNAGTKQIRSFERDVELRVGLLDPVALTNDETFGMIPMMLTIDGENPYVLPEKACIIHIHQQNGCPQNNCRLTAGPLPIPHPVANLIMKGIPYVGQNGVKSFIDFTQDMTQVNVTSSVNGNGPELLLSSHVNMEVIGKRIADHVFATPSSSVAPGAYLSCSAPAGTGLDSTVINQNQNYRGMSAERIGAIMAQVELSTDVNNPNISLATLRATYGVDGVQQAMREILTFRSLAVQAASKMAKHAQLTDVAQELKDQASAFLNRTDKVKMPGSGSDGSIKTGFVRRGQSQTLTFYSDHKEVLYTTPQHSMDLVNWSQNVDVGMPQLVNDNQWATHEIKTPASAVQFYRAGLDRVYESNVAIILGQTVTENWASELTINIPSSFTKTTTSSGPYYYWNNSSGENLKVSGMALDFSRGHARVTIQADNIQVARLNSSNTWAWFTEKDATTGFPTTIVSSQSQLNNLMSSLAFTIVDPTQPSSLTFGLEVVSDGDVSKQARKTISFDPVEPNDQEINGTFSSDIPDFNVLITNMLFGT